MRLSKRLKAISEFINENDKVIDIGCDHALLDIYLKETYQDIKIIASDIHEGAIKMAKTTRWLEGVRQTKTAGGGGI